ncbi:MAG: nucleotidyltransferase domain-containing protein [Candidatus Caldarchaeum sp.]
MREGAYFIDVYGDVYAVKGLVHPPGRVYAVPRLLRREEMKNLQKALQLIASERSGYLFQDPYTGRRVIAVPRKNIKQVITPSKNIKGPPHLVETAKKLSKVLSRAGVEHGFTGSLLLGTADNESDIDIVIYGGAREYKKLKTLRLRNILQPVDESVLHLLAKSRLDTPFAQPTLATEQRKILTGKFEHKLYTMKIVPRVFWESWHTTRVYLQEVLEAVVEITDARQGFTTPSRYRVRPLETEAGFTEIISFRSRFAEMGARGERLRVHGLLEKVVKPGKIYHRLNVGIDAGDYMAVEI